MLLRRYVHVVLENLRKVVLTAKTAQIGNFLHIGKALLHEDTGLMHAHRGQIIGKSGDANISTDLGNHLHFEMILNGKNINPENCYGKEIGQL